jgi:hypothetical protein
MGLFLRGKGGWGVKLTARLNLVLKLRMSGAIPLFPHTPSWRVQRQIYLSYTAAWNFRISRIIILCTDSFGLKFMNDLRLMDLLFRNSRRKWKMTTYLGVTSNSESCEIWIIICYKFIKSNSCFLVIVRSCFFFCKGDNTSIIEGKVQRRVFEP